MIGFYLGTHMPNWLTRLRGNSLFVSHLRLRERRTLKRATTPWALDSGGFTQITQHGAFQVSPAEYVAAVDRYDREIGNLEWAAPQDWMCEPAALARTGLTVLQHQVNTVQNFIELCTRWEQLQDQQQRAVDMNSCPFMPVLQGWTVEDYLRCAAIYEEHGCDLNDFLNRPGYDEYGLVGVGSVCRRQSTDEIGEIFETLAEYFPLHGFGVKTKGLAKYGRFLTSADSMAWSMRGRNLPGCDPATHSSEANCIEFATRWAAGIRLEHEDYGQVTAS